GNSSNITDHETRIADLESAETIVLSGRIDDVETALATETAATNADVTDLQTQINNISSSPAAIAAAVESNDAFDLTGTELSTESGITGLTVNGDLTASNLVSSNGTFTGYVVASADPTSDDHLANKSYVDAGETASATARGVIQSDVDTNESDGDTDRAAIRTEFAAADATLQGDVDTNEADGDTDRALIRTEFAAADATLQGDVNQNEADADAGIATNVTDIAANVAAIAAETASRTAADNGSLVFIVSNQLAIAEINAQLVLILARLDALEAE
ncbi:MAG: hypothetical protein P8M07_08970, partial [Flavobacteriales bacterium]|nr:hypothetical protein [Flavobacteriales bacterium]